MNEENPSPTAGLVDRIKTLILTPSQAWPGIAAEETTPGDIIARYALPLAAIGPVAGFIGGQLFGINLFLVTYHPGLLSGLTSAAMAFVMGLVSLIVVAILADSLAPNFGGESDRTQAFKLVAAAMTPGWVAGILGLVPALAALGIIAGIYGIYLFYAGAMPLMKVPKDKAPIYVAVVVVAAIVLSIVASTVTGKVSSLLGMGPDAALSSDSGDKVDFNIPGVGKFDSDKIEEVGKQMEGAANGQTKSVDATKLQGLLPNAIGGYTRTSVESNAVGQMGSTASARYSQGNRAFELRIVDSAGLGAIAGLGAAMGVAHSKQDADGYERVGSDNGMMVVEKWNTRSLRGEFSQQIASRFVITADGEAASIDELKAAVAAVDKTALIALGK